MFLLLRDEFRKKRLDDAGQVIRHPLGVLHQVLIQRQIYRAFSRLQVVTGLHGTSDMRIVCASKADDKQVRVPALQQKFFGASVEMMAARSTMAMRNPTYPPLALNRRLCACLHAGLGQGGESAGRFPAAAIQYGADVCQAACAAAHCRDLCSQGGRTGLTRPELLREMLGSGVHYKNVHVSPSDTRLGFPPAALKRSYSARTAQEPNFS